MRSLRIPIVSVCRAHPLLQGLIAGVALSVLFACAGFSIDLLKGEAWSRVHEFGLMGLLVGFVGRFLGALLRTSEVD